MNKNPVTGPSTQHPLAYASARRSKQLPLFMAIAPILLCIFQFPWVIFLAWMAWAMLWGDNAPPGGGLVVLFTVAALPSLGAIILGANAARSQRWRVVGIIGILGATAWCLYLFRGFAEMWQERRTW
jgi:hypothetical protein